MEIQFYCGAPTPRWSAPIPVMKLGASLRLLLASTSELQLLGAGVTHLFNVVVVGRFAAG